MMLEKIIEERKKFEFIRRNDIKYVDDYCKQCFSSIRVIVPDYFTTIVDVYSHDGLCSLCWYKQVVIRDDDFFIFYEDEKINRSKGSIYSENLFRLEKFFNTYKYHDFRIGV